MNDDEKYYGWKLVWCWLGIVALAAVAWIGLVALALWAWGLR
jgi:hypothetical protein